MTKTNEPKLSLDLEARKNALLGKIATATTLGKRAEVKAEAEALVGDIGALEFIKVAHRHPQRMHLKGS